MQALVCIWCLDLIFFFLENTCYLCLYVGLAG
jgi:hypothetical protein